MKQIYNNLRRDLRTNFTLAYFSLLLLHWLLFNRHKRLLEFIGCQIMFSFCDFDYQSLLSIYQQVVCVYLVEIYTSNKTLLV